jgi:hypothetical protein
MEERLLSWMQELSTVRVLDPACGSGNFLYVALRQILELWHEASSFGAQRGLKTILANTAGPQQLYGIETDFYAHQLASIVVWIGYLQWRHETGQGLDDQPIPKKLENIDNTDAILRYRTGKAYEPLWPDVDYIVGNPPFLGGKFLRRKLGDEFVDDLFRVYAGRVPAEADLVTYWFGKARAHVEQKKAKRVGLLATQAIRGGANRLVLKRVQSTASIFWAQSNRPWLLDGAAVRISMVAFDKGKGNDPTYVKDKCFDTYPFPWAPGQEPNGDSRALAIAAAARRLVERRDAWLNPQNASSAELAKRTLTNLYNQQPQWLHDLHTALDRAVAAAYGWKADISDDGVLARLLDLNLERSRTRAEAPKKPSSSVIPYKPEKSGTVLRLKRR